MEPIKVHITRKLPANFLGTHFDYWKAPDPISWKVIFVLEELGLPYEINCFTFQVVKQKPYININPNGRVPAIEDPNTGITLWQTGAIIQYLIELYDAAEHKLSYPTVKEKHLCNQGLAFQISGQGPYFGQAAWFNALHPEKLPSAIERYTNEVRRVLGVLNGVLEGKQWLVGDKMTFADLAFVPWNDRLDAFLDIPRETMFEGFSNVEAWHNRTMGRPARKAIMEKRTQYLDEQGLQPNGFPKGVKSLDEYGAAMQEKVKRVNAS